MGRPASTCCQWRAENPCPIMSSCVRCLILRRSRRWAPRTAKKGLRSGSFTAVPSGWVGRRARRYGSNKQFHHEQISGTMMGVRRQLVFVVLVAGVVVLRAELPRALAADDDADVARVHFDAGKKFYDVGEYQAALRHFKAAHLARPDPVFLYNIAQCHRQLGHVEEAVKAYRRYLSASPAATNRREVEQRITDLERAAPPALRAAAPTAASAAPTPITVQLLAPPLPEQPPARPFYRSGIFWLAASAVVVAGIAIAVVAGRHVEDPIRGNADPGVVVVR